MVLAREAVAQQLIHPVGCVTLTPVSDGRRVQMQLFLAEVTRPINTLWATTLAIADFGPVIQ